MTLIATIYVTVTLNAANIINTIEGSTIHSTINQLERTLALAYHYNKILNVVSNIFKAYYRGNSCSIMTTSEVV